MAAGPRDEERDDDALSASDAAVASALCGESESITSELLQRYEMLGELGRGGFGVVFKARQRTTGQLVAIKQIRATDSLASSLHEEMRRRFKREMSLIGNLRNAHVVRLLDAGADDDNLFMVLEFVDGVPLSRLLASEGALPQAVTERIIGQVLEALAEAHEQGIVHRDLKPDNIMISGTGLRCTAKVLDFGIAGVEQDFRGALEVGHETITKFGQFLGTPSYMAPEQFQLFDNPRVQTDIYAMGLILFECLTGHRAVTGSNLMEIAHKQAREPIVVPPVVSPEMAAIIRRATDKAPDQRFQSADEMLRVMHAVASGVPAAELALLSGARREVSSAPAVPTVNVVAGLRETVASDPALAPASAEASQSGTSTRPATPRAQLLDDARVSTSTAAAAQAREDSRVEPAPHTEPSPGRRRALALVAVLLVAALGLTVVWFASRGDDDGAAQRAAAHGAPRSVEVSASPSSAAALANPAESAAVAPRAAEPAASAALAEASEGAEVTESAGSAPELPSLEARIQASLLAALTAQSGGRLEEAAAAYGEVLALAPTQPDALEGLARLEISRGAFETALGLLERLAEVPERAPSVTFHSARALRGLERGAEAREQLERYLEHWPEGPHASDARAQLDELKRELRKRDRSRRPADRAPAAGGSDVAIKGGALHEF